jgi:hypothetical protein
MRPVVAAIDYRPRHSGGGCTLCKQTPRPATVASPMGQYRKSSTLLPFDATFIPSFLHSGWTPRGHARDPAWDVGAESLVLSPKRLLKRGLFVRHDE